MSELGAGLGQCWLLYLISRIYSTHIFSFLVKSNLVKQAECSLNYCSKQCDQSGWHFNSIGDLLITLAIIFGKTRQKWGKILGNFWNGTTFSHLGHYDLIAGAFFPKQPGHTGSEESWRRRPVVFSWSQSLTWKWEKKNDKNDKRWRTYRII